MTQKFFRNYQLTIDPKDGGPIIVIGLPFTCRFAVKRDILASVNNASIDILNLSRSNRRRIFQDRNNLGQVSVSGPNGTTQFLGRRNAKLDVGYGKLLYTIWQGDILQASSAREGVDIVTRIESLVGIFDFAASQINITLAAGTTLTQVFQTLAQQMPTLTVGYISKFDDVVFPRPVVLNGKPWDLIIEYSQYIADVFTDNGKLYIMATTDKITNGGPVPVINAASGLLETPRREQSYISVTTLLEANIQINSLVQIDSVVEPAFNGQYAVIGIQHAGIISGAVSGECRSTFFLLKPEFAAYNQVQPQ